MAMPADVSIAARLEDARLELLDLTARNRLIHTPRRRTAGLNIVEERSRELYRLLVVEGKSMTFLPRPGSEDGEFDEESEDWTPGGGESPQLIQPDELPLDRHVDLHLQTWLTSETLQKKLLRLYYDARTFEEEQGVNVLFLALGFLKWFEDDRSDVERFAPLLLVPVQLDRRSANARFRLSYTDDEIVTNLSLKERLRRDFGITLPEVSGSDADDEFSASDLSTPDYFDAVRRAISERERWEVVDDDVVLWFFSFSKFLMYRDLDPGTWPEGRGIGEHELVRGLLEDGFRPEPPLVDDAANIDDVLDPADMVHVLEADSSQSIVIEEVRRGRNLVVQGPPGTGKSQTIANVIAAQVEAGRRVLFVSEKMAALEVVKRRLDGIGLGDMCLELHSHKSNKRAVLDELERTLALRRPTTDGVDENVVELGAARDRLNRHARAMHGIMEPSQLTPYRIVGELVRLRSDGVPPTTIALTDSLSWTPADVRERVGVLADLAVHLADIGVPDEHPWRGVRLGSILPTDVERLVVRVTDLIARLERLDDVGRRLGELLHVDTNRSLRDGSRLARLAQHVVRAPEMDRAAFAHRVWDDRREDLDRVVEEGRSFASLSAELGGVVADVAWETDVAETRRHIAAHGRSWFRWFSGDYRSASATLRGILRDAPPRSLDERIALLDRLLSARAARDRVDSEKLDRIGRAAFGTQWRGRESDWERLGTLLEWEAARREEGAPGHLRELVAELDRETLAELVGIASDLRPTLDELAEITRSLELDRRAAFAEDDLRRVPIPVLIERLRGWLADPEAITKWIAFHVRWRRLHDLGLGELAECLLDGTIGPADAVDRFRVAYHEDGIREVFRTRPELAEFDGISHEQQLARFRELDERRLVLARQEVAAAHHARLPTHGGEIGEVGLLKQQMKRKRNHLPVRRLIQRAGNAIQAIKPVFMMSPVSVAQYLAPGAIEFDVLLVDEASQVRPVDALGAIGRARQVVVVGDDRQLPPTHFFDRVAGNDPTDDEDTPTGDIESVLGLCESRNMTTRMLEWHYRSRHQSLIAVSNREFYDSRLFVVPSPYGQSDELGLRHVHVPDGVYDRGGSRTNRVEARRVAEAVMRHARTEPRKSLGVAAFSVAQRDAIIDEVELLRRDAPDVEPFFNPSNDDPFFVKNLENVQGDERDVILISVGYGRDESGYMTMSFGPLNGDGGERRMNVLISRARERCVVFSSIQPDDIDLNRTASRGVRALKTFLTFASRGILDGAAESLGDVESEFERQVARALVAEGFTVDAQVGVAGFRVDLAVVDPDRPGRYLLGIECDGATYQSARSARDRDRLRQKVLEDRDWIIHRIWSTDWFRRPDEQLRSVADAIERARAKWAGRDMGMLHRAEREDAGSDVVREESEPLDLDANRSAVIAEPYVEASFPIETGRAIHELEPEELARVVVRIVEVEGPVHQEEIARRVTALWGLGRTGSRINRAVEAAIDIATHRDEIEQTGAFLDRPDRPVRVRTREEVASTTLRKADNLPPSELAVALVTLAEAHHGAAPDELVAEVSRLLGFRVCGPAIRDAIRSELDAQLVDGGVVLRDGRVRVENGQTTSRP